MRTTRSPLRRLVGTSVVVLATVLPAGVAAAAAYPSGGTSSSGTSQGTTAVKAATTTNPSTLPFTGGDVAGLAVFGVGAALAGTVLVRRSRRQANA